MKFINPPWKQRKLKTGARFYGKELSSREIIHLRPEHSEKQLYKCPRCRSTGEIQLFISSQAVGVLCKRSNKLKLEKTNERDSE